MKKVESKTSSGGKGPTAKRKRHEIGGLHQFAVCVIFPRKLGARMPGTDTHFPGVALFTSCLPPNPRFHLASSLE